MKNERETVRLGCLKAALPHSLRPGKPLPKPGLQPNTPPTPPPRSPSQSPCPLPRALRLEYGLVPPQGGRKALPEPHSPWTLGPNQMPLLAVGGFLLTRAGTEPNPAWQGCAVPVWRSTALCRRWRSRSKDTEKCFNEERYRGERAFRH